MLAVYNSVDNYFSIYTIHAGSLYKKGRGSGGGHVVKNMYFKQAYNFFV